MKRAIAFVGPASILRPKFSDVGSGAERTTNPGKNDRAGEAVELDGIESRGQLADELVVQRVQLLGPVQPDHRDWPVALHYD